MPEVIAARKTHESLSGNIQERVVPPIIKIGSAENAPVGLFDLITVDRIVQKEGKIRKEIQFIIRKPGLRIKGLLSVGPVVLKIHIVAFGLSALAIVDGVPASKPSGSNLSRGYFARSIPVALKKSTKQAQIRVGGGEQGELRHQIEAIKILRILERAQIM